MGVRRVPGILEVVMYKTGDRVRLTTAVEVFGVKGGVFRGSKGERLMVVGMFRGNVEVTTGDVGVTLPASVLERC